MKLKELVAICNGAIPQAVAWDPREPYGAYNTAALGGRDVQRVLYCVTATTGVSAFFRRSGYDLLISHHPTEAGSDIPQLIYHTALDCCIGGLNDIWADHLGMEHSRTALDRTIGRLGGIEPRPLSLIIQEVRKLAGAIVGETFLSPACFTDDPVISRIAVCTGLGGIITRQVAATGVDLYITGEMLGPAAKSGLRGVIEVGHTLSEAVGVGVFRRLLPCVQVDLAPTELDVFNTEVYQPRRRRWFGAG